MKVSIYMALSANGLTSNSRNNPYWLSMEFGSGFMEISQKTQAVIMGKVTYNILAPDHLPLQDTGTTVVLTHDLTAQPANNTVIFTDKAPGEILQLLEDKGHQEAVIVGGTATVSEFMRAGLVDEVYFIVEPVLFGSGLPLLKDVDFEYQLHLMEVKQLNDNTVRLHYKVQKA